MKARAKLNGVHESHLFRDTRHACRRRCVDRFLAVKVNKFQKIDLRINAAQAFSAPEITIRYFHYSLIRNRHFCITKPREDRNDLLFLPIRAPQIGW